MHQELTYGYDDQTLTHQPRVIFDYKTNVAAQLLWDANGNLSQIADCNSGNARFHLWNEENRLHAVIGPLRYRLSHLRQGHFVWSIFHLLFILFSTFLPNYFAVSKIICNFAAEIEKNQLS